MELRKRKMIKWIKSLIEKIFGKKEKPIILEDEIETVVEKIVCSTHKTRFKKSCPVCRAAGKW